ncbi:hypothetical protein CSV80_14525 [Sporosarcina sp. P12(2017)]|uniref:hypothetical protein n=1 Tax=unclassified Sporosarcina TaxID=2647733 RepID=UPI000C167666|nr:MULTISPECIES: hypothetical protein [unclassified Sporosarcina]PIC56460.1 hypothetical protein CSV81_14390 [Sporosarcina sp. P10]PIC59757.1 hypothetical protein CSV80_14525 [Sporosarcina sp. P12(2017)]
MGEVLRIGTPFTDEGGEGVNFHNEITDSESIGAIREIVKNADEIDRPKELKKESDVFISLDETQKGISEIQRYIYYQEDGSSILLADGVSGSDGFPSRYFILNEKQTNELKNVLQ